MEESLGYQLYAGTLNVKLRKSIELTERITHIDISEFGRGDMPFRFFKALLEGYPVWVVMSLSLLADSSDILELVADRNLREELGIEDGDTVQIQFGVDMHNANKLEQ